MMKDAYACMYVCVCQFKISWNLKNICIHFSKVTNSEQYYVKELYNAKSKEPVNIENISQQ